MDQDATGRVGLGPGDIVRWGPSFPLKRRTAATFWPMSIVAKRSPISATAEHLLFYMSYYCNTERWTWWDGSLILKTYFLQCFDTVGWVI